MDRKIIERTGNLLSALDFTAENAEIEALEAEIARNQVAITTAQERCGEISRALSERAGPDPIAVADALLEGAVAIDAAAAGPGDEEMRHEAASLRAGIQELMRRNENARLEVNAVRDRARDRAAACVQPIVDAITADMRDAAEQLVQSYAAISAIDEATRGHGLQRLAARGAVSGIMGMDKLLNYRRETEVPAAIVDALGKLTGKGTALRVRVPSRVPSP